MPHTLMPNVSFSRRHAQDNWQDSPHLYFRQEEIRQGSILCPCSQAEAQAAADVYNDGCTVAVGALEADRPALQRAAQSLGLGCDSSLCVTWQHRNDDFQVHLFLSTVINFRRFTY